jgi:hypothetical protein
MMFITVVVGALAAPDVGQQQRRRVDVVHRHVEETLDLVGMQVHRQHPVGADRAEHLRHHLGRDRHARRTRAAVLAGVAEIRHHGGDVGDRGALERVDQHHQLHEVLGGRRAGRLDDEHVLAAHVLLDLDLAFAVRELPHQRLAQRNAELAADRQRQRAVGIAGEDEQVLLAHGSWLPR